MDARRAARAIKHAGGGSIGAASVLTRQLRALHGALGGADLQIRGWLGPRDLAEALRTAYDPHASRHLAERRATANDVAARIELRRMWFAQDIGFAMSALPLGFGLPRKRW
jgi:hypothetical protein